MSRKISESDPDVLQRRLCGPFLFLQSYSIAYCETESCVGFAEGIEKVWKRTKLFVLTNLRAFASMQDPFLDLRFVRNGVGKWFIPDFAIVEKPEGYLALPALMGVS